jgi:hypothetical protein
MIALKVDWIVEDAFNRVQRMQRLSRQVARVVDFLGMKRASLLKNVLVRLVPKTQVSHGVVHLLVVLLRDLGLAVLLDLLDVLQLVHVDDLISLLFLFGIDLDWRLFLNLNLVIDAAVNHRTQGLLVLKGKTTSAVAQDCHVASLYEVHV